MKALVTGATGFTGGYMVDNLLAHGYEVRAFVRPTSNLDSIQDKPIEVVYGFLESAEAVREAMKDIDVVFHIAAMYRSANEPEKRYYDVNVKGTRHVLEAAHEADVKRVVHCSTAGVHGHVANPPADETAPFNPGDIYQETKLQGEQVALEYGRQTGLPVTVVRPIGIFGPGDLRMLKLYRLIQKGRFIMFGSGAVHYHLTYVTDTVEGFRLAAESERAVGEVYIIGGDGYFTLAQFARTVADVLGCRPPWLKLPVRPLYGVAWLCESICVPLRIQPPIFRRRVDIFVKDRAFDISKAKRDLGYQPKIDVREGIRRTAEWYREQGLLE
jgi:nucleoside-diphosphate-sugar epimerase